MTNGTMAGKTDSRMTETLMIVDHHECLLHQRVCRLHRLWKWMC